MTKHSVYLHVIQVASSWKASPTNHAFQCLFVASSRAMESHDDFTFELDQTCSGTSCSECSSFGSNLVSLDSLCCIHSYLVWSFCCSSLPNRVDQLCLLSLKSFYFDLLVLMISWTQVYLISYLEYYALG
jgi:hypothetical protein